MAKRSLEHNRFYWGIVIPHSSQALLYAGWEKEIFIHEELVHKFWKDLLNIHSTTALTSTEFSDYIEDIIRICAVYLDYVIPD